MDKNGIIAPPLHKLVSKLCVQMGSDPLHAFLSTGGKTTYNLALSYGECLLHNYLWPLNVQLCSCGVFLHEDQFCPSFKEYKLLGNVPWIFLRKCQICCHLHRNKRKEGWESRDWNDRKYCLKEKVYKCSIWTTISQLFLQKNELFECKHQYICSHLLDRDISKLKKKMKQLLWKQWQLSIKSASKGRSDSLKSLHEKTSIMMVLHVSEKEGNPSFLEQYSDCFESYCPVQKKIHPFIRCFL